MVSQVAIVGAGLQIWRVAANTGNPQLSYTIRPENVYESLNVRKRTLDLHIITGAPFPVLKKYIKPRIYGQQAKQA
jgi:hypothetical protein